MFNAPAASITPLGDTMLLRNTVTDYPGNLESDPICVYKLFFAF